MKYDVTSSDFKKDYLAMVLRMEERLKEDYLVAGTKSDINRAMYWLLPDGYALPPHTINVCVNSHCFFKCKMCDFGQERHDTIFSQYNFGKSKKREDRSDLPLEVCKRIVDDAQWFRPVIRVSFVEPLLYPDLIPFLEYTKSRGLPFWTITNGYLLDKMAEDLVRGGLDLIRISLDGPPDVHDEIRGIKGSFDKAIRGAHLLVEERKKMGAKRPLIGFNFTLSSHNATSLYDFVKALDTAGILPETHNIDIQWMQFTSPEMAAAHNARDAKVCGTEIGESSLGAVNLDEIEINDVVEQTKAIKREYIDTGRVSIRFRPSFEPEQLSRFIDSTDLDFIVDSPRCRILWNNLNLNSTGEAKTFHRCLLPSIGNYNESEDLWSLWNNPAIREQRLLLKKNSVFTGCSRCWGAFGQ